MSVEELIVNPNQSLEGRYGGTKGFSYVANLEEEAQMPTLKGSLILEGGSEAYPQQITGIKLYNEDGTYNVGIQTENETNGASYIELNQIQLGENTQNTNTNNYATGIIIGGGATLSTTKSNINAEENGIMVQGEETSGVITIGDGTTLIGGTGAGIENMGTIKSIRNQGEITSTSGVGIKNTGTIGGSEENDGIDNTGTIGNIVGGLYSQSAGTIEGEISGINNSGTIGNIEYLSKIEGTNANSYGGIFNQGVIGAIDNRGEITSASGIGIKNVGTIGSGSESYAITNGGGGTIGNIVGGTDTEARGVIVAYGIANAGTMGNIEYLSEINRIGNFGTIREIINTGTIGPIYNSQGTIGFDAQSYGIDNMGTIAEINNRNAAEITSVSGVGIKNTGTIGSSDVEYGIYNAGTIGDIIGGTSQEAQGTIESRYPIYNQGGSIGDIEYMKMIKGENENSSYGIYNAGTIGDIIGGTSQEVQGTIEGVTGGIVNTAGCELGNIEYVKTIKGTNSYGISNYGTMGNLVGGSSGNLQGTIVGRSAITNAGTIGNIEYFSKIEALRVLWHYKFWYNRRG